LRSRERLVFDTADPYRPQEVVISPQPTRWLEPPRFRAKLRQTADLFVAQAGLIYLTDHDAALCVIRWQGA
jgi:hypothetical protein